MIDIGANLAHESYEADRSAVLARAREAGIEAIVVTGSCLASSRRALELAHEQPDFLYATAGLHPHHASDYDPEHEQLFRELAADPHLVATGECGLDYFRDLSPRADQRHACEAQLRIAVDMKKPVFLHQRDAHADFLPMLREFRDDLVDCVVHCFTDTEAAMDDYLALDCHIGITGWICDERRGQHLLSAVAGIPDERLLIETDSPYLLPRTIRPRPKSRRNEPMHLHAVAQTIASARGVSEQSLAVLTTANARRFFRLDEVANRA